MEDSKLRSLSNAEALKQSLWSVLAFVALGFVVWLVFAFISAIAKTQEKIPVLGFELSAGEFAVCAGSAFGFLGLLLFWLPDYFRLKRHWVYCLECRNFCEQKSIDEEREQAQTRRCGTCFHEIA